MNLRAVGLVSGREAVQHVVQRCRKARQVRLLGEVAECGAGLDEPFAVIRLHLPGSDFHQGRFARSVTPDQTDPFSLGDGKVRTFQQRCAAESQMNVAKHEDG